MKAVIVEIRGDTAAALGRDGSVFKVKNRAYAIGQTIHVPGLFFRVSLPYWPPARLPFF